MNASLNVMDPIILSFRTKFAEVGSVFTTNSNCGERSSLKN